MPDFCGREDIPYFLSVHLFDIGIGDWHLQTGTRREPFPGGSGAGSNRRTVPFRSGHSLA